MGMCGLGHRLVLPTLLLVRRVLSDLLPVLAHIWLRSLVQPLHRVYGTAGRIYGPYGGVGYGARYNPSTGTYARGAFAYGPYGARGAAQAYNPRTGTYASTRQGAGVYGSWGSTSVVRGDNWANTKRFTVVPVIQLELLARSRVA